MSLTGRPRRITTSQLNPWGDRGEVTAARECIYQGENLCIVPNRENQSRCVNPSTCSNLILAFKLHERNMSAQVKKRRARRHLNGAPCGYFRDVYFPLLATSLEACSGSVPYPFP